MTDIPQKIPFDPPNNGDQDFGNRATTALLALPNVVNEADAGNQYQEDLFNTPTSKGILPTPTGLGANTRLLPLRLNDAGTALTANLESSYSDGGEIVQFKGLDTDPNDNLFGYRRRIVPAGSEYIIKASESNTGDVIIYAIVSGRFVITVNDQVVFERTDSGRTESFGNFIADVRDYRFVNLEGNQEIVTDFSFLQAIRVVKMTLTHSDIEQSKTLSVELAGYGGTDIAGAMAEENGYKVFNPGHLKFKQTFTSVMPFDMRTPTSASLLVGGHDTIPASLFDAQLQTGSGFNFFAS